VKTLHKCSEYARSQCKKTTLKNHSNSWKYQPFTVCWLMLSPSHAALAEEFSQFPFSELPRRKSHRHAGAWNWTRGLHNHHNKHFSFSWNEIVILLYYIMLLLLLC